MIIDCPNCKRKCLNLYGYTSTLDKPEGNRVCSWCMQGLFHIISNYEGKEIYGDPAEGIVGLIDKRSV